MPLLSMGVCCSDWEDYSLAVGTADARVMIERFAFAGVSVVSEFLDLNHTRVFVG
jgi:hypothetical protein